MTCRHRIILCLWSPVLLWSLNTTDGNDSVGDVWFSGLSCESPRLHRLLRLYPFCSVAMNSYRRRATTPIDFCVCHLWPARITLQIYTAPDPEKCFQLPPAGVSLLCWANWNGTPRTLDKATKLRHRATATAAAAAAIDNIKVWGAQKPRSAVHAWISKCGWFSRGFFGGALMQRDEWNIESLWPWFVFCTLGRPRGHVYRRESHDSQGWIRPVGEDGTTPPERLWGESDLFLWPVGLQQHLEMFNVLVPSVFGEIFFKKQRHVWLDSPRGMSAQS